MQLVHFRSGLYHLYHLYHLCLLYQLVHQKGRCSGDASYFRNDLLNRQLAGP